MFFKVTWKKPFVYHPGRDYCTEREVNAAWSLWCNIKNMTRLLHAHDVVCDINDVFKSSISYGPIIRTTCELKTVIIYLLGLVIQIILFNDRSMVSNKYLCWKGGMQKITRDSQTARVSNKWFLYQLFVVLLSNTVAQQSISRRHLTFSFHCNSLKVV